MKSKLLKAVTSVFLAVAVTVSLSACAVYSSDPQLGYNDSGYYSSHGGGNIWHGGWRDRGDNDGWRR